jgi:hypothetical protein
LFICITGAFRGYYQGKHNMMPTAISRGARGEESR